MTINRIGAKFHYAGITYTIGDTVIANAESEYEGLFGTIAEIRDGNDQETDNDTPDIYCTFIPPFDPEEIKTLESRFSYLYGQEKKLKDITLDIVIMAPEMITILNPVPEIKQFGVYEVREEWISEDDAGITIEFAFDEAQAKRILTQMVNDEKQNGVTSEWCSDPRFKTGITPLFFESGLDGEYSSNHYRAAVYRHEMCMGYDLFEAIGKTYIDMQLRKHFAEQIECWDELENMTDDQINKMIALPTVPQRIRKHLAENAYLRDAYWESVSEASFALVKTFKEGLDNE